MTGVVHVHKYRSNKHFIVQSETLVDSIYIYFIYIYRYIYIVHNINNALNVRVGFGQTASQVILLCKLPQI